MAFLSYEIVKKELKKGKTVRQIAQKYKVTRQAVYSHIYNAKKKARYVKKSPKKNYNCLIDWRVYNEGLVKRGEFLLDFSFFKDWKESLAIVNRAKRGRPFEYPDCFILFFLRLKGIFKIDYRTLEGIARKLVVFIPETEKAPDYTTFKVRARGLKLGLEVYGKTRKQDIAGDASGLKTTNRGEYRMRKYRGRRKEFVKLHLAVNTETKQIVYCNVTVGEARDGKELPKMITEAKRYGKINSGYFDAGYDSSENYGLLEGNGIIPVIRPRRSMSLARVRKRKREITDRIAGDKRLKGCYIRLKVLEEFLTDEGRWKKRYGFGRRWMVEGRYSVFKRIFSEHVYSKKIENIRQEVMIKIGLLNLFTHHLQKAFKW